MFFYASPQSGDDHLGTQQGEVGLALLGWTPKLSKDPQEEGDGQAFLRAFLPSFPADEKSCVTVNNSTNPTAF